MRSFSKLAVSALIALAVPAVTQAQDKDVMETATAAGSFKTLVRLLTESGLAETLRGPGPFTVFAPTDEAFAKLPAGALEALSKDRSRLKSVLLYHVVAGKISAADALKLTGKTAKTVEGSDARISAMGATPMINNAHVTQADMAAKNGVIHAIDAVMLPPAR